jgi:hypothetical protein
MTRPPKHRIFTRRADVVAAPRSRSVLLSVTGAPSLVIIILFEWFLFLSLNSTLPSCLRLTERVTIYKS